MRGRVRERVLKPCFMSGRVRARVLKPCFMRGRVRARVLKLSECVDEVLSGTRSHSLWPPNKNNFVESPKNYQVLTVTSYVYMDDVICMHG